MAMLDSDRKEGKLFDACIDVMIDETIDVVNDELLM